MRFPSSKRVWLERKQESSLDPFDCDSGVAVQSLVRHSSSFYSLQNMMASHEMLPGCILCSLHDETLP